MVRFITAFKTSEEHALWKMVERINNAWINNQPELLMEIFHENMSISGPDFLPVSIGREACIKSYKDFISQASYRDFTYNNPRIDIFDKTAIVSYYYELIITMDDFDDVYKGKDVFIFIRADDRWLAIWRIAISEVTI